MTHFLITGVENVLRQASAMEADLWMERVARQRLDCYTPGAILHLLNEYWHARLASCGHDTIPARSALRPDLSPEQWLDVFTRYVAPTISVCTGCQMEQSHG